MNVVVYSTNCPKCKVLESKLAAKQIPYEVNTDVEEMRKLGIMEAPMLEVDGELLGFVAAVGWVNGQ